MGLRRVGGESEDDHVCAGQCFANLAQAKVMRKEGTSTKNMISLDWHVGKSVGGRFLINSYVGGHSSLCVVPFWAGGPEFYNKVG